MHRINLLPWRAELRKERQKNFAVATVGAIVLGLLIMLLVNTLLQGRIDYQNSRNQRLQQEIAVLDEQIKEIRNLRLRKDRLLLRMAAIDELQSGLDGFRILKGIESDILRNGGLDYADDILERFDLVVVAIHNTMAMDEAALTARVIKALEHPASNILAHPTGRLLLEREGHRINLEEIIAAAAANNVALELNTHPARFDLDWRWLRRARDAGCRIAVDTDAHRIADLDSVELGCGIARKGWLTRQDVVNTLTADELLAWARV